jgi:phage shock protein PspC (stress-responsive transcriptional regulator)
MNTAWDRVSDQFGLYREPARGWIAGVCAGIAEKLQIGCGWVRLAFIVLGLALHGIIALLLYIALAVVMKKRPVMMGEAARPYAAPFSAPPPPLYPNSNPGPMPHRSARHHHRRFIPTAISAPSKPVSHPWMRG